MFCIETPQCSFFWQTSFIQEVIHHTQLQLFNHAGTAAEDQRGLCWGSMWMNLKSSTKCVKEFSSSHRHDGWGPERISKEVWATTMETAYPMPLARLIAAQFILALQRLGISRPAQTLSEISCTDNAVLPVLRAQAGGQPKAARLPPLIPHFVARLSLTGFRTDLPSFGVLQTIGAGDQHNECANNTPQGFKTFATLSCSAAFNSLSRGGCLRQGSI